MVSISNRNMAPRGPNPNVTTIIAKVIPDHIVMVVDVVSDWHMEKDVTGATRKTISQGFAEAVNPPVVVA